MPDEKIKIKRKTAQEIIKTWDYLFTDRSIWETHWKEVVYYLMPHKENYFGKRTSGSKLPTDIYDSTQIFALQIFAAGLH